VDCLEQMSPKAQTTISPSRGVDVLVIAMCFADLAIDNVDLGRQFVSMTNGGGGSVRIEDPVRTGRESTVFLPETSSV
jgi:hypothetical protein